MQTAIKEFRRALEECPVSESYAMAKILFNLGIALERSGQRSLAAKSWLNARKLVRRGYIVHLYSRWVNEYGMRRNFTPEQDDFKAFQSIQVMRYLSVRGAHRFCSDAERDVVYEVIEDAWKVIARSRVLHSLSIPEKLEVFKNARLDFPYLSIQAALKEPCEPIIGNFAGRHNRSYRVKASDLCPCGSGLPYMQCCGHLYSCTEQELSGSKRNTFFPF
ncbi:MAG: SEC-C domain-containing protein [Termitinemataceae bacterium]